MRKLDHYIFVTVLASTMLILLLLVCLEGIFSFLSRLNDIQGNYQLMDICIYTLLLIPKKIYQFLPSSTLLGCLTGLGSMASNSELIVMRAAGVSLIRILLAVMKPALLMIITGSLLGEYLAPLSEQIAETRRVIARSADGTYSGEGIWHREGNEFMYFNAVEPNGVLYGISRYRFDDRMKLLESSFAERGIYQKNHWLLENVKTSRLEGDQFVTEESLIQPWNTSLTTILLKLVVVDPDALSISGLLAYTHYLKEQELDSRKYDLAFWAKVFHPVAILSLVLLGISFVFGPLRSVSMGARIFYGVITSVIFMIIQKLMGPTSLVFGFPPIISVLIPIFASLVIGFLLLSKAA